MALKWHEEARRMRSEGARMADIGATFGVTTERARQVCKGVICPVDHVALWMHSGWQASHRRKPVKRMEREKFIRTHYKNDMTAAEIGKALGITRNAVISSANGLGLCTPSTPQPKQTIPHT